MPRSIGILGAKGRTEIINIAQRQSANLGLKLSGDGQERLDTKKIFVEINFAIFCRDIFQVKGSDPKNLAGSLGIRGGNHRGMDIIKAPILEKLMNRK